MQSIEYIVLWPMLIFLAILSSVIAELILAGLMGLPQNELSQSVRLKLQGGLILFVLWWLLLYCL